MLRGILNRFIEIGRGLVRFVQRLWDEHQELLNTNPVYRRQLEAGVVALLGACSVHPTAALVATVALAIYIAAHETSTGQARPDFGGQVFRRGTDREWEFE